MYIFQTLEGSMLTGELLFCGGSNWDLVGRKQVPKGGSNFSYIIAFKSSSFCHDMHNTVLV